jgi:protein TonB
MGEAARSLPPEGASKLRRVPSPLALHVAPRFDALIESAPQGRGGARRSPWGVSVVVHTLLIAAILIIPLFSDEIPPATDEALRAFFAMPAVMAPPPPPPPPPPAAGARPRVKAPAPARPMEPAKFVAPIEVPEAIAPEETLSLGVEGGVPGGVEGGVPGGVVGGIVGGLPQEAPPPPARVVRIGGQIKAPKLLNNVAPAYPQLAIQARLSALLVLQLHVGADGRVRSAEIVRGQPLFDEAALEAVRQWRYAPLLLNGVATEFIVNVTVSFRLQSAVPGASS